MGEESTVTVAVLGARVLELNSGGGGGGEHSHICFLFSIPLK